MTDEAVLAVAKIGPAHGGYFELRLLPGVVAGGGAVDGAVGNFVGGEGAAGCEREGGLEEDVRFVPVEFVVDVDLIAIGCKAEGLHELWSSASDGLRECRARQS